jgi:AraC-like DNA-binding protein
MDVLEALLDGPRARGAFLLRAVLEPPWSMRIEDEAPLTVMAVLRGSAWVTPEGGETQEWREGHVAVARGPAPYTVADRPDSPPSVVVLPGGRCTSVEDGRGLWDEWSLGVRTWGSPWEERTDAATVLLIGTYEGYGEASRPLLAALPPVAALGAEEFSSPLLPLLAAEMAVEAPGQRALLDRLLDALLISFLRTWFAGQATHAPGWFRAQADPAVATALGLMHDAVAHPWTVAELADRVGVSRPALARRFTALLGESPMAYLAAWRLAVAADLLCSSDATIATVAREVGYGTPFSLSAAFKRVHGVSPQDYRRARAS